MDFDARLSFSAEAFASLRYMHEASPSGSPGWNANPIIDGVIKRILQLRPDFARLAYHVSVQPVKPGVHIASVGMVMRRDESNTSDAGGQ